MKVVICFLDKQWPPNHSFIDGMLSRELASLENIKVDLIVSKSNNLTKNAYKYNRAVCMPLLFKRSGIYRILNFFKSIYTICIMRYKYSKKNLDVIFFVRNDPIYLLACSLFKKSNEKLIFQSSFPHENVSGNFLKRWIAKKIYQISSFGIDSILAVSPQGLVRVHNMFPKITKRAYIPLLSDQKKDIEINEFNANDVINFVYIGSHSKERKINYILEAIYKAIIDENIKAKFHFIGAKKTEIDEFCKIDYINNLIKNEIIKFTEFIPRNDIWDILKQCDVGLCLIPPDPQYKEASPTKLTEYMGEGLAVLASYGIELQEEFVTKSNGGYLVEWDIEDIKKGIVYLSNHKEVVIKMKENAYLYAKNNLNYQYYIDSFLKLM